MGIPDEKTGGRPNPGTRLDTPVTIQIAGRHTRGSFACEDEFGFTETAPVQIPLVPDAGESVGVHQVQPAVVIQVQGQQVADRPTLQPVHARREHPVPLAEKREDRSGVPRVAQHILQTVTVGIHISDCQIQRSQFQKAAGIVIGKEVFGGTGRNILNPALTGRAFLYFSYPVSMSGDVWVAGANSVDGVSAATALAVLAPEGEKITTALTSAGYTLSSLFFGLIPGSIGGTSALCCLVGAVFLMATRIASFRIIIGGIAGLIFTALMFYLIPGGSHSWANAGPLYHLFAGGFLFGISFMATDPVSAPGTNPGRWIYGFLIGFLTVTIRVANPAFVEGIMLAILFMNVFSPLLDHMVIKYAASKRIPNV